MGFSQSFVGDMGLDRSHLKDDERRGFRRPGLVELKMNKTNSNKMRSTNDIVRMT